jgi:hypothetical protein
MKTILNRSSFLGRAPDEAISFMSKPETEEDTVAMGDEH